MFSVMSRERRQAPTRTNETSRKIFPPCLFSNLPCSLPLSLPSTFSPFLNMKVHQSSSLAPVDRPPRAIDKRKFTRQRRLHGVREDEKGRGGGRGWGRGNVEKRSERVPAISGCQSYFTVLRAVILDAAH